MSWITVWFIRTSIIYLFAGTIMGIIMAVSPETTINLKFIHVHLNLLGFMSMMIFGVGYHIFPRFSGRPLWSEKLATVQFWTAQIGLWGMVAFYPLNLSVPLILFSLIMGVSVFAFLINMLKTIRGL